MIEYLKKYQISKGRMYLALTKCFELEGEYKDACEKYYILRWSGAHFKHVMHDGLIIHQGVRYLVIYNNCTPTDIKTGSRLYVSFRKPSKEFELQAYVLVSISRS